MIHTQTTSHQEGYVRTQKTAAWSHLHGIMVWTVEHNDQWGWLRPPTSPINADQRHFSYIEQRASYMCKNTKLV